MLSISHEGHNILIEESEQGNLVIVSKSGHAVIVSEPELVVSAFKELITKFESQ